MKIAAVIAEYDPFHNGHKYLLNKAAEDGAEVIVVIMSGAFTQRGEVATFSKFDRTAMALAGGADLVVELPVTYAVSGAKRFAAGGVKIAQALHATDLYFGSECGDLELLSAAADIYNGEAIRPLLKAELGRGKTFAAARKISAEHLLGKEPPAGANDNLAAEYIEAIKKSDANIVPHAVKRNSVLHDSGEPVGEFASASFLRGLIRKHDISALNYIPADVCKLITAAVSEGKIADHKRLEKAILYRLRTMSAEEFANLPDVSEGLENRLSAAARNASTLEEYYALVKSRRYTLARIKRITTSALIGITRDDYNLPPHIRILGTNDKGQKVIGVAGRDSTVISRTSKYTESRLFALERRATDIAALAFRSVQPSLLDFTVGVIKADNDTQADQLK